MMRVRVRVLQHDYEWEGSVSSYLYSRDELPYNSVLVNVQVLCMLCYEKLVMAGVSNYSSDGNSPSD